MWSCRATSSIVTTAAASIQLRASSCNTERSSRMRLAFADSSGASSSLCDTSIFRASRTTCRYVSNLALVEFSKASSVRVAAVASSRTPVLIFFPVVGSFSLVLPSRK